MKFPNPSTGTRPGLPFGLLMLLLVVVSGVGFWGVMSISGTTVRLLRNDSHIAEHAARCRANVLGMRRFEKDAFLNVGDAAKVDEYCRQWNGQKENAEARLADLEKATVTKEDKEKVKLLRANLALYAAGFDKVHGLILEGKITTPAAANAAIAEYKHKTREMENTAREFATEGNERMDAAEPLVQATTRKTVVVLAMMSLLAVVVISDRKRSERAVARSVRAYKALGRCNEAMVRIPDEARLIEEVCRILVEEGGYRLAWVGCAERDENRTVRAAGWAGDCGACLGEAGLTWGEGEGGRGPTGTAIRTGRPVVVTDIPNDPIFSRWMPEKVKRRFASAMALPLACGRGDVIGALNLYSEKKTAFDREEINLMIRLANDLAYGIHAIRAVEGLNRLNRELAESQGQLRDLACAIESTREEERTRIAREIHDVLGQELTVMKMEVAWLEKRLQEEASLREKALSIKESIDAAIGTVRRIASELRPGVLDHLGIAAAVAWQTERFASRTGIACAISGSDGLRVLGRDRETALFRICQEALTNVARHSGADRVDVRLSEDGDSAVLTVADNGKGLCGGGGNCGSGTANPGSLGLIGIRERVLAFGGTVEIGSVGGCGTRLTVRIPFAGEEKCA